MQLYTFENLVAITIEYERTVFATSLTLIFCYSAILLRTFLGSKYRWLIWLTLMLIVSNICSILSNTFANQWMNKDPSLHKKSIIAEACTMLVRDALFNLAHWLFCYKYWIIAYEVHMLLQNQQISVRLSYCIRALNVAMILLDILLPLGYVCTFYILNLDYENQQAGETIPPPKWLVTLYLFCNYSKGMLLVVAATFLFDALRRFKAVLKICDFNE